METDVTEDDIETKHADHPPSQGEVRHAVDEFLRTFEAFKSANNQRLGEIERRMAADVLTAEKVERLNRAVDEQKQAVDQLALAGRRPALGGATAETADPRAAERKERFARFMRSGAREAEAAGEVKALSAGSDPDGGYLVPDETERGIERGLASISPIRAIATVRRIGASVYKKPFATAGAVAGWAGETDARTQTTAPTLAELEFPAMELYAMPAATQTLLDDAAVDIGEWLAQEVDTVFAEQESQAFVTGDGDKKPTGFLSYSTVANASWAWGKIGVIKTGADGAFPASDPSDILVDLVYSLRQGYRANASFVMNRAVQAAVRKLKDADGNYLWQPGIAAGGPATLIGRPVVESEHMPDLGADSLSIAFGDFARGYLVVDRVGMRVLRDPYTAKPYVLFYTTKRVGGGVQDFEAIKLLQFGD